MPNLATSAAFVETATKCLRHRPRRRPEPASDQARAVWALVIVSSVVKVLEETMKSVSAGSRSRSGFGEIRAIDVGDEAERHVALAVVPQRLVRHDRAEIGAADPDVDDVADALSAVSAPLPCCAPVWQKCGHSVQHAVDLGDHILAVEDKSARPQGPQSE